MAEPKFHISRDELEFVPFPQSEVSELIDSGFLLPTDLFWSEGQIARRPLSERAQAMKPSRTSLAGTVKRTLMSAAGLVRTGAVLATAKVSSATNRKKATISKVTNRMLEDFVPRLRGLVAGALENTMHSAGAALRDEVFLRKLFGIVHDMLPKPVRRFVGEEMFVEFCLRHKEKLLRKES